LEEFSGRGYVFQGFFGSTNEISGLKSVFLAVPWGSLGCPDEQVLASLRLSKMQTKANSKDPSVALAKGQQWRTKDAYIQIVGLGKRLIDYKLMKQLGQTRRTQTSSIEIMEAYLKRNEARLIKGNSRN